MSAPAILAPEAASVFFNLESRLRDLRCLCWAAKCIAENGQDYEKDLESTAVVIDRAWMEADAILSEWDRLFGAARRAA